MATTGTGKLKEPKKCVKTVTMNPRSSERVGAPRYICPTSGGKQAVASMGKLPVKPEDVERVIKDRKKLRLPKEAGPQKLTDTIHFKDPKESKWETPYDTIHYKDPTEAKGQDIDDTIHFEDPQEAQEKKQMKLFGKSLVEKESIYLNGDLVKAKPFSFQQTKEWGEGPKASVEKHRKKTASESKASQVARRLIGSVKQMAHTIGETAPLFAEAIMNDYRKNPEQAAIDLAAAVMVAVPEPTSTAAGAVVLATRLKSLKNKAGVVKNAYTVYKKQSKLGRAANTDFLRGVERAEKLRRTLTPAQIAAGGGSLALTGSIISESLRGKGERKPEIVHPREHEAPERRERREAPEIKPEIVHPREHPTDQGSAEKIGPEDLIGRIRPTTTYDAGPSERLAKEPVHKERLESKEKERKKRKKKKPGGPFPVPMWVSGGAASGRKRKEDGSGDGEGGPSSDKRAGSRKKRGGTSRATVGSAEDVRKLYSKRGGEEKEVKDVVSQFLQAMGGKKPRIKKSFNDSNRHLSKSISFIAPIARQVRSKKISLKSALDRVPWWMQDDLLEYLRGKKK